MLDITVERQDVGFMNIANRDWGLGTWAPRCLGTKLKGQVSFI